MIEPASLETTEENEAGVKQLFYKVWENRLETIWNQLERAGFRPILIKGWAAAQFYPNPFERQFVDIDLMFDAREFAEVEKYLQSHPPEALVDLHRGARHLDELAFTDLYNASVLKRCGESQIRVPCDEDHLRILCVHWLNDGGADRKRLEDIYYAIKNRATDFDWERCLGSVSRKRRKWVICVIVLANKYLDLNINEIPLTGKDRDLPGWLTRTIENEWESGIRLKPIHTVLNRKTELWQQLQKRFLPNPIQATIETGGAFDNKPRIFYQLGDIMKRSYPSLKRILHTFSIRLRNK